MEKSLVKAIFHIRTESTLTFIASIFNLRMFKMNYMIN